MLHIFTAALVLANAFSTNLTYAQVADSGTPIRTALSGTEATDRTLSLDGINVSPENPLRIDLLVGIPASITELTGLKEKAELMARYILSALTAPDDGLWVNLSPDEADRIIPAALGETELGAGMLEQDYALKQLTARLTDPATPTGKAYWSSLSSGDSSPSGVEGSAFSKVWIVPDTAIIRENDTTACIVEARLKVETEDPALGVLLPELEDAVNSSETFRPLRQMYRALILAVWYAGQQRQTQLSDIYAGRNMTKGIDLVERPVIDGVYDRYVDSVEKGVFDREIKERDSSSGRLIKRRYASGGIDINKKSVSSVLRVVSSAVSLPAGYRQARIPVVLDPVDSAGAPLDVTSDDRSGSALYAEMKQVREALLSSLDHRRFISTEIDTLEKVFACLSVPDALTEQDIADAEEFLTAELNEISETPEYAVYRDFCRKHLKKIGTDFIAAAKKIPGQTMVIIQAAGRGTRLNTEGAPWIDKNTEKMGGLSQLERQLNQLSALGYRHVTIVHNARNFEAVKAQAGVYAPALSITFMEGSKDWMSSLTTAVTAARYAGFKNALMLNCESLVPIEYLGRVRWTDRRRMFGFHRYPEGKHEVSVDQGRLTHFKPQPSGNAGHALLTFFAPIDELLEYSNLEAYISETWRRFGTGAFDIGRQVPDLNLSEQLEARRRYHFNNPEFLGPFPQTMVHPRRLARALLMANGYWYPDSGIEDDRLHDANNRGTVWLTKDRRYVVKSFVGVNDSRAEFGRFSDERYRREKKFLQHKVSLPGSDEAALTTPYLVAGDDDLRILIMNNVVGKTDNSDRYYNIAELISTADSDAPDTLDKMKEWLGRWMHGLAVLQASEPMDDETYSIQGDLRRTFDHVRYLHSQDFDVSEWTEALRLFNAWQKAHRSLPVAANGDFAPLNFIISGDRDVLIDGEYTGVAPAEKDLATALVRLHQMNMRTLYIRPNRVYEKNFPHLIEYTLASYLSESGRSVDMTAVYFFMAQDFMQRAYDQILFKNDDLSPRLYLELSRAYLQEMRRSMAGRSGDDSLGTVAAKVFHDARKYSELLDALRWRKISPEQLDELMGEKYADTLERHLARFTLDREAAVRENAFAALRNRGYALMGGYDLARDYRYVAYRMFQAGDIELAITLLRHALALHGHGPGAYAPYVEKMKAVISLLKDIRYTTEHGIPAKKRKPGKRVLIAGGGGFLGERLIAELKRVLPADAGIVVADFNPGSGQSGVSWARTDLRDPLAVRELFDAYGGFDQVVMLAAMKLPQWSAEHPAGAVNANVLLEMYKQSAAYGSRIVQMSTAELYPLKDRAKYTETSPIDPTKNPYALSKFMMEVIPGYFNVPAVSLRLTNLFGAGQGSDVISVFSYLLYTEKNPLTFFGNIAMDFLYVDDAARIIARVVNTESVRGLFNVSTNKGIPITEAAEHIRKSLESFSGKTIPRELMGKEVDAPLSMRVLDNSKLAGVIGPIETTDFYDAIDKMMLGEVRYITQKILKKSEVVVEPESVEQERLYFLRTGKSSISDTIGASLEGVRIGEMAVDKPMPDVEGKLYTVKNNPDLLVEAGPCPQKHRRIMYKGLPRILYQTGYSPETNVTFWAFGTGVAMPPLSLPARIKVDDKGRHVCGTWAYMGDIPAGDIKNIPPWDGYWVNTESKRLVSNADLTHLLIRGDVDSFDAFKTITDQARTIRWAGNLVPEPGTVHTAGESKVPVSFSVYLVDDSLMTDTLVQALQLKAFVKGSVTGGSVEGAEKKNIELRDLRCYGRDAEGNYLLTGDLTLPAGTGLFQYHVRLMSGGKNGIWTSTPGKESVKIMLPDPEKRKAEMIWAGFLSPHPGTPVENPGRDVPVEFSVALYDKKIEPAEVIETIQLTAMAVCAQGSDWDNTKEVQLHDLTCSDRDKDGNVRIKGILTAPIDDGVFEFYIKVFSSQNSVFVQTYNEGNGMVKIVPASEKPAVTASSSSAVGGIDLAAAARMIRSGARGRGAVRTAGNATFIGSEAAGFSPVAVDLIPVEYLGDPDR